MALSSSQDDPFEESILKHLNSDHLVNLLSLGNNIPLRNSTEIQNSPEEKPALTRGDSKRWKVELLASEEHDVRLPARFASAQEVARSVTKKKKVRVNLLDHLDVFDSDGSKQTVLLLDDEEEPEEKIIKEEQHQSITKTSSNTSLTSDESPNDATSKESRNVEMNRTKSVTKFFGQFKRTSSDSGDKPRHHSVSVTEETEKKKLGIGRIFHKDEKDLRKRSASVSNATKKEKDEKNVFIIQENAILRLGWDQIQAVEVAQSNPIIGGNTAGYSLELGQKLQDQIQIRLEDEERLNNFYYRDHFKLDNHIHFIDPIEGFIISLTQTEEEEEHKSILRAVIRTPQYEGRVIIGLPDNWKTGGKMNKGAMKAIKETHPVLQKAKFIIFPNNESIFKDLLKFETTQVISKLKMGILLRKEGQTTEDQMFSNKWQTNRFDEFLNFIGDKTILKGFKGYHGGLDVKTDTTGTHTVFTSFSNLSIMFHVSTMLPHQPADIQQVEVKRHLGNDIIVIIFNECSLPYDPTTIVSEFNHVYCVIQPVESLCNITETYYRVGFVSRYGVPPFGPSIPFPPIFKKGPEFREFLITKLINAECAALEAPSFSQKLKRTRAILLKEVAKQHSLKKK